MAYVLFVLVCLIFGSNFKLMDDATEVFGPLTIALGRLWGGALVLLPIVRASGLSLKVDPPTLGWIVFVGVVGNAYPFAVQPWILSHGTDHSFLAVFVPLTPLLTIAAAIPLLSVRPTWQQSVGVLGGLAILGWIVLREPESHHFELWLVPLAVSVPLAYAVANTMLRRQLQHVSSMVVTTLVLLVAGLMLLPLACWELSSRPPAGDPDNWASAFTALAILGPVGTGICIAMFIRLVQDRGPLFAGMVTYLVPIVALLWGYHDGEYISTAQLTGIAGILAMVALVQSSQANYRVPRDSDPQEAT